MSNNKNILLEYIAKNPNLSSKELYDKLDFTLSYATLKRHLSDLVKDNLITTVGRGKGTKYIISSANKLLNTIDTEVYFEQEIDERSIKENFNFELITNTLNDIVLFTEDELTQLNNLQQQFSDNISKLSNIEYNKELERLAIDLSWKSSQIEGNTYSLLETELLLKEQQKANGKTIEDATMLLNHKDAIDFIVTNPNYVNPLTVARIEDIHSILMKDLNVDRNIRKRRVGISGTNYKPLDNEHQIKEALSNMCTLINSKTNVFERALLLLVLISYIQAFADGNKRTARIISNAILIQNNYCPLSFRTIDSIEYKKAMLIFYEQNNISVFKKIFIDQFTFAVNTYF